MIFLLILYTLLGMALGSIITMKVINRKIEELKKRVEISIINKRLDYLEKKKK